MAVQASPVAVPGEGRPPDGVPRRSEPLQSLVRGIAVIQVFSHDHPALTLSEVARLTAMTRATARRILHTLEDLGHVRAEGRYFSLTPRVLSLGWAYLSSLNLADIAHPLMEELVEQTRESCSASTLDLPDIVYVARVPTRRIMTISIDVGTRLPAHPTSMGRVLLADLSEQDLDRFLEEAPLDAFTDRTITDSDELRRLLASVREQGWALTDQELEIGLRSIAAPLRDADGRAIAALNVSAAASRVSIEELKERCLPHLLRTAEAISTALGRQRATGARGPATEGVDTTAR
jgi:IclR family pca regulon transcriptional regulator